MKDDETTKCMLEDFQGTGKVSMQLVKRLAKQTAKPIAQQVENA